MRLFFKSLLSLAAVATLTSGLAYGQADPEIEALEDKYHDDLLEIRDDLGAKWLSALSNLKDELTREHRFAEALLVKEELERVKAMLGSELDLETPPEAVSTVTLRPPDATLSGKIRMVPKGERIGYWSEVGASATWDVPANITPGTYELILHYQAGVDGGGTLRAEIGDDQVLSAQIVPDRKGSWRADQSVLIGECVLDEHTAKLKLVSTKHLKTDLMNVLSVDLAPQGTWAGLQAAASDSESDQAPAREFEKLEGARWVDVDSREPGEIVVNHGDKQHTFRLYFIAMPPVATPSSTYARSGLARLAKRLRTSQDQILRFGRRADKALRDELWASELTIYTRWESRGREGRHFAYVLTGDTPVSLWLIENGYALTGGAFANGAPFIGDQKGAAKEHLNRLRAAEKDAKKSRAGLWGL